MNLAGVYYNLKSKISAFFGDIQFFFFQKPLYVASFNRDGNQFHCKGKLRKCRVLIGGENNTLIIEKGVTLNRTSISMVGSNNTVIIQEGTLIRSKGRIRVGDNNNTVKIGKNADISEVDIASADNTNTIIGDNCLLSANIFLRSNDGHSILNEIGERINPGEDIIIGNSVWIGYGASILKGSIIGDNCIIGTETVIPGKTIPSGSIVVGNPGKIVKTGIHWCKERIKTD